MQTGRFHSTVQWSAGTGGLACAAIALKSLGHGTWRDLEWTPITVFCVASVLLLLTAARCGSRVWYGVLVVAIALMAAAAWIMYGMRHCCMI